jgi:hypothetical protein
VLGAGKTKFEQIVVGHDRLPRFTKDERARGSAVVPLALEKRLFLNASCRCLLVPLLGKKYCDINKRLTSF